MTHGHGDDIYNYKNIKLNFSSNTYNDADLSGLQAHLSANMWTIRSYPEPDAASLARLLAEIHQLPALSVCVTNGATEGIYLIAQAFKNSYSSIVVPTFSEYTDACLLNGHQVQAVASLDEIPSNIQVVWLCNPNNPTGLVYDAAVLEAFIASRPQTYFVIDQSYAHFTTKKIWEVQEAAQYPNVILLHSMTKHYTIPGLRLGYITAYPDTLAAIRAYCIPWSVNQLAVEAGKYLLTSKSAPAINVASYLQETVRLQTALNNITGITAHESDTHFFLSRLKEQRASVLKDYLAEKHGILIRDASNFEGLGENYFRIATQSTNENDQLINALLQWIQTSI